MQSPETSSLFTAWTNPDSGITSHILSARVAPVQQSFYYTNPSFTKDGRYLWFRTSHPPPGGRHGCKRMAVADLLEEELRLYPETDSLSDCGLVDPDTGDLYWGSHLDLWKRGPGAKDEAVRINSFPKELCDGTLFRLFTHPGFSPDKRHINVDARFIRQDGTPVFIIGEFPVDGSPFRLWQKIVGRTHDHALYSPTDGDVQMFAWEYWAPDNPDAFDGNRPYHRLWKIRRGEEAQPILPEPVTHSGHEWWDADGKHIWYLHYGVGVKKVEFATGREVALAWPGNLSHAHSDASGSYLVADQMEDPGNPDCCVRFRNLKTGREVEIVNRPPLAPGLTQCTHLHPHPQFCLDDRYVCYTTTIHDRVDVALVPTESLIKATS